MANEKNNFEIFWGIVHGYVGSKGTGDDFVTSKKFRRCDLTEAMAISNVILY